jgi:hypothetical protein
MVFLIDSSPPSTRRLSKNFDITGVKVLKVAKDPRMGAHLVQLEFDEMSPVRL